MANDILRRPMAPITLEAWEMIDEEAKRVLSGHLSARKVVDFDGSHGWMKDSRNLGTLEIEKDRDGGLPWGLRRLRPLLEVRSPFRLPQMELDSISRGNRAPDLDAVATAARSIAIFEESAIYRGLRSAAIQGMEETSAHEPVYLTLEAKPFDGALSRGIEMLQIAGVNGPYALALGTRPYQFLMREMLQGSYTLKESVRSKVRGEILWTPALDGGVLLSTRGGDFCLTVGQDISIGYVHHDRNEIEFYLVESFTFLAMEPKAHIILPLE